VTSQNKSTHAHAHTSDKLIIAFGQEPVRAIQGCHAGFHVRRNLGFVGGGAGGQIGFDDGKKEKPAMLDWTKDMCL
jgi:hypothetical protein